MIAIALHCNEREMLNRFFEVMLMRYGLAPKSKEFHETVVYALASLRSQWVIPRGAIWLDLNR